MPGSTSGRSGPAPARPGGPAAITCGLLASAATVPAAFAKLLPGMEVVRAARPAQVGHCPGGHPVGMAGWQITVIALGTALLAAAAILPGRAVAPPGRPPTARLTHVR